MNELFNEVCKGNISCDAATFYKNAPKILLAKDYNVLIQKYEEKKTLEEIGNELGICRERVRQFCADAIDKLKNRQYLFKKDVEIVGTPIVNIEMSRKTYTALFNAGIVTIEELDGFDVGEFLSAKGVGATIVKKISDMKTDKSKDIEMCSRKVKTLLIKYGVKLNELNIDE